MTSGIRNNWMKAVRLCMDLQNSSVKRNTVSVSEMSRESSPRTVDDIDLNSSAPLLSRKISANHQNATSHPLGDTRKKDGSKNIRRHYSDVNPGNVGKMLSVKEMLGVDINSMVAVKENTSQDALDEIEGQTTPKSTDAGKASYWLSSNLSLGRYVEGSESTSANTAASGDAARRPVLSESRKEEEERRMRAKSPSARIKEKSRSKSLKLSSSMQTDGTTFLPSSDQYMSDDSDSEIADAEYGASSAPKVSS